MDELGKILTLLYVENRGKWIAPYPTQFFPDNPYQTKDVRGDLTHMLNNCCYLKLIQAMVSAKS